MVSISEEFLDLTVQQLYKINMNNEQNVKQENVLFEAILLNQPRRNGKHTSESYCPRCVWH